MRHLGVVENKVGNIYNYAGVAQLVELLLAMQKVAGSSPVSRSIQGSFFMTSPIFFQKQRYAVHRAASGPLHRGLK